MKRINFEDINHHGKIDDPNLVHLLTIVPNKRVTHLKSNTEILYVFVLYYSFKENAYLYTRNITNCATGVNERESILVVEDMSFVQKYLKLILDFVNKEFSEHEQKILACVSKITDEKFLNNSILWTTNKI